MAKKVKKQRKKRDFSKVKNALTNIFKTCGRISIATLGIASLAAFLVIPFLHNYIDHNWAQWIWYIALPILVISTIFGTKTSIFKDPLMNFLYGWGKFSAYPIFASIFVFNYYEIDYIWMWVIFGLIALLVPIFFISFLCFNIKNTVSTTEDHQEWFANIAKYIILYWFIDLLYMSIFNNWLVPTFIFGILSIVIIFFNLINAFLNGAKSIHFFIALEMIIALIMSGYLIFIIPDETIQEIVLTITAALYGGILTLVGVAWTIKQTHEDDTKKDIQRNTPYLRKASDSVDSQLIIKIYPKGNYHLSVELISDAIFIFKGAIFNNKFYSQERLIAPKTSFTIVLNVQDYDDISLIGSDIFGNNYKFDLNIKFSTSSNIKIIESIGLPMDILDFEIPREQENVNE